MARPLRAPKKVQVKPNDDRTQELYLLPHENEWTLMEASSISTVTIYEEASSGSLNLTALYDHVASIVKKNPWLTGRLKMMPEGILLFYGKQFVDCFQAVARTARFSFDMSYDEVVSMATPYLVKKGMECIDKDESLFKVSVLVSGEEKKQIVMVFSVSTIIADVHTFYLLYDMMNSSSERTALNATRNMDYSNSLRKALGKKELSWMYSSSSRQNGITLSSLCRSRASVRSHYVDEDNWLPHAKRGGAVGDNWVSTNDVLTSWFFNLCQCDYAFMKVNFRNRLPDLDDKHAGNYSEYIIYRPEDFDRPLLLRRSLSCYGRAARLESRLRTGKTYGTSLPGVLASLKNKSAAAENWCGAYRNVLLPGCMQLLHLPIIADYNMSPHRNTIYIFKPTAGAIGMLTFERDDHIVDNDYNPRARPILKAQGGASEQRK